MGVSVFDSGVYYHPEKHGLTLVSEVSADDDPWAFDIVCLFKHDDGRFFAASDCGCSCPAPFENYHGLDDLIRVFSLADLEQFFIDNRGSTAAEAREEMMKAAKEAGLR